jgi:four helix bundle protein
LNDEPVGRFSKQEQIRLLRLAQGSMYETLDWIEKSKVRQFMPLADYNHISGVLHTLPKAMNSLITFTTNNLTL